MDIPKTPGRKPRKQNRIAEYLRGNIISGAWKAGQKIPPRAALEKQFNVSSVTIQRTLTPLVRDGFLRVVPNRGTFVNEKLPHILNYALALPKLTVGDHKNIFFQTLRAESQELQRELSIKIIPYDNVIAEALNDSGIRLIKDIRAERLAGIIFTTAIHLIKKSPIVLDRNIPRVVISAGDKNLPFVSFDSVSFIDQSLDYLLSRGRKRVALISSTGQAGRFADDFRKAVEKRKMMHFAEWHQMCQLSAPEAAVNIMRLLTSKSNTDRPDGLVVSDDNLIASVCEGLDCSGVGIPEDLEVVSHCNFPHSFKFKMPVKFIGFDTGEILKTCIRILQAMRAGKKVDRQTMISACTK